MCTTVLLFIGYSRLDERINKHERTNTMCNMKVIKQLKIIVFVLFEESFVEHLFIYFGDV